MRYRREIGKLSLLFDSLLIGKQNFLICYQKAREDAIRPDVIKNGWKGIGLWPKNIAKPLINRLLFKNNNSNNDNNSIIIETLI